MAKKDMATLHREHEFHINQAEDLTTRWMDHRVATTAYLKDKDMGLRPTPYDEENAPNFYLQVAGNGLAVEQSYIRQIKRHRRKAARIGNKLNHG